MQKELIAPLVESRQIRSEHLKALMKQEVE
jgi:hypothetical protein